MYPTDPEHLHDENKGLSAEAPDDQQNLHFGMSSSDWELVSSSKAESTTLSTSSYSSNSG